MKNWLWTSLAMGVCFAGLGFSANVQALDLLDRMLGNAACGTPAQCCSGTPNCGADACGADRVCGPTCGADRSCGVRNCVCRPVRRGCASCGAEPTCAATCAPRCSQPTCGSEPCCVARRSCAPVCGAATCGAEPTCGAAPACGVDHAFTSCCSTCRPNRCKAFAEKCSLQLQRCTRMLFGGKNRNCCCETAQPACGCEQNVGNVSCGSQPEGISVSMLPPKPLPDNGGPIQHPENEYSNAPPAPRPDDILEKR